MNRSELKVGAIALALIALAAIYLGNRKNVLGKPGLVMEAQVLTNELGEIVRDKRVAIPGNVPGYKDELLPITATEVKVLPKDTEFGRRRYIADGAQFQVSAVLMGTDRTSLHDPSYCVTGQGWHVDAKEVTTIPMARPQPYELKAQLWTATHQQLIGKDASGKDQFAPVRGLFMFWYVSEDQLTPIHWDQMVWMGRDLLLHGTLKRWAYVSMFSWCAPGQEKALLQKMKRLAADVVPVFQIPPSRAEKETAFLTQSKTVEQKETFERLP
jgi:hypothetical protein